MKKYEPNYELEDVIELVQEAIADIKAGRIEDGLLTLERAIDPKFEHSACAQFDYDCRDLFEAAA